MQSDNALLRMILHTHTEALRLGYVEAAELLDSAARSVAHDMHNSPKTILTDDILRVVEEMIESEQ